jgi:hypothetical protein
MNTGMGIWRVVALSTAAGLGWERDGEGKRWLVVSREVQRDNGSARQRGHGGRA